MTYFIHIRLPQEAKEHSGNKYNTQLELLLWDVPRLPLDSRLTQGGISGDQPKCRAVSGFVQPFNQVQERCKPLIAYERVNKYTVSQKNWATFIFTVTLANVGRFLKFFQCRNQKEMAHNVNEKFPTVA